MWGRNRRFETFENSPNLVNGDLILRTNLYLTRRSTHQKESSLTSSFSLANLADFLAKYTSNTQSFCHHPSIAHKGSTHQQVTSLAFSQSYNQDSYIIFSIDVPRIRRIYQQITSPAFCSS